MVRTEVELTEDQAGRLEELAHIANVSVGELLSRAVDSMLRIPVTVARPSEEQRRRAIAASGRFHSGATDLGENHDKYLAEAFAG